MSKKPWMPLYIGDYLRKTTHLDATGSGAYLHLIMHYWDHGMLPDDDRELARIAKLTPRQYAKLRPSLIAFFQPGWRHHRIEEELQRYGSISEKRSRAGIIGNARKSQMRSQMRTPGDTQSHKNITTTETVPRSKEDASRGKEGNGTERKLEPTVHLVELETRRKDQRK